MGQRVTYATKEQRRDQRRPVSIAGSIGGIPVDLVDLSVTGVGGGTIALGNTDDIELRAGQRTALEFAGPDGQTIALGVKIERIDHAAGEFGAVFDELSDQDFDAIEKLMFPRRGAVAYR